MSTGTEIELFRRFHGDEDTAEFLEELKGLNYIFHAAFIASIQGGLPHFDVYLLANRVPILLGKKQDKEFAEIHRLYIKYAWEKWHKINVMVHLPLSPAVYTPERLKEALENKCRESKDPMFYMLRNISEIPPRKLLTD